MHADAGLAVALALGDALGHRLLEDLALEVGQLEILEHDVDQLVERDLGLVVVEPGARCRPGPGPCLALAAREPTTWPGSVLPSPVPTPPALSP